MSLLGKIKDEISRISQRALGIDAVRFNQQVTLETLARVDHDQGKLSQLIQSNFAELGARTTQTSDQLQNLRLFLTWYSNRVEPWYWTGNFALSDPEEELAGLLFNFLPGSVLLNVGPKDSSFTKAAAESGYEVHYLAPPNNATLPGVQTSSDRIDFVNITRENVDAGLVKALDSIQPAVIQIEFADDNSLPAHDGVQQKPRVSTSEIIKELREKGYYWNVIIYRTEVEGFIRMGTNLASVPEKAWGNILFFRDHQLFLKAFHWCKSTLPRYRASRLAT
jgi:hypothetical protein